MQNKHECFRVRSEITAFALLHNDTLAFSTKIHGAKILSYKECSTIKNLSIEQLGHKTTAVTFSKSENLLAFANNTTIYIIDTQSKLLIQTIRTFEGEILKMLFIPNSRYLISGTKNGRVMQYRYDGRSGLSRLCSFGKQNEKRNDIKQNYISAFAFYDDILAIAGYGGKITILKMNTYTDRYTKESVKARINALCFIDRLKIASGNVDGMVVITSLKKYQLHKTIQTPINNINTIILMPNPKFILVSGDSQKLILIDVEKAKIVSVNYLSFDTEVSHMEVTKENYLLVVLSSQRVLKVKLPSAEDIKEFIFYNELDKAYKLIDKDPMLQNTREHKRVEVMYEKLYTQAMNALIHSSTKEARTLIQMFNGVSSKKNDVNSIFRAYDYYPRFTSLYHEKKYALAYALAERHPALQRTAPYKKMEEQFKESYTLAQKQILIGKEDQAKEILSVYATVLSKRSLINFILKQNRDFIEFLKAVHNREYKDIEKLLKINENFSQIPSYKALKNTLENSLEKIQNYINKAKIDEALKLIKSLIDVPTLQNELQTLYNDAKLVTKLQGSYNKNNFKHCYEILDSSQSLATLELSEMLEKHWSKLIYQAEEFALKGDLKSIKKTFGELLQVNTRTDKIGDTLRVSFHVKIKALIAKKSFKNAQTIIYSYIDTFGVDSEMQLIMRSYEKISAKKLAITNNQDQRVPRDNWCTSPLIVN